MQDGLRETAAAAYNRRSIATCTHGHPMNRHEFTISPRRAARGAVRGAGIQANAIALRSRGKA